MTPLAIDARRHAPFRFRSAGAFLAAVAAIAPEVPFDEDVGPLLEPLRLGKDTAPNRITVQPMEGCDAQPDGAPGELAASRYRRFAAGGSGIIWFEATSIDVSGRANPRQLMLTRSSAAAFEALVRGTREAASSAFGQEHRPVLVLQLTHSGRYGCARPRRVAFRNPHLDAGGIAADSVVEWRDEELAEIAERFVEAAVLAREVGFDVVDIKACHGYLASELLAAHTRPDSAFGGPFENRVRFLLDIVRGAEARGVPTAVRLGVTDAIPHPFGFGTADDGSVDTRESMALARRLSAEGCRLLNVTAGIPAYRPHIGRPCDRLTAGVAVPAEHPLVGVARLIALAGDLQRGLPSLPVVGTGYSWLRQFWPNVGAAVIRRGLAASVGLGRGAFAYPDAPLDLLRQGRIDPGRCCVACSYCSELLRARQPAGCVVRDRARYRAPVK